MKHRLALSLILALTCITGCSAGNAPHPQSERVVSPADLWASMQSRYESQIGFWVAHSLRDQLPSQAWSINGRPAQPVSAGIAEGSVIAADPGSGFIQQTEDAPRGTPIEFTNPRAAWRSGILTIKVRTPIGKSLRAAREIRVGVTVPGGDPKGATAYLNAYRRLDHVLIALSEKGKYGDPSVYGIGRSGALFGSVSPSGQVSFPALGEEEDEFLGDLKTVDDVVRAEARSKPARRATL